jgi:hypothetical protein
MTSSRRFRLVIGLLLLVVPLWALLSRLDSIWNGHPAYPATLFGLAAIGVVLVASTAPGWRRAPERVPPAAHGTPAAPTAPAVSAPLDPAAEPTAGDDPATPARARSRTSGWRIAERVVVAVLVVAVLGVLVWLRPFPAGDASRAALASDAAVTVIDHPTTVELVPTATTTPPVGLVFSPGARVDARAYAALLRPAAEAGYLVVILKEPFGLAITQIGQSAGPIADHPEVGRWVVGGHSLGGVSAAWFAGDHLDVVDGLLLWASFPNDDMSGDISLQVESIYGSNDLLATPADIERSRSKLPPDTTFTEIEGGVHAFFGDYGEQPGDGVPAVSREQASEEISAATTAFLGRVGAQGSAG